MKLTDLLNEIEEAEVVKEEVGPKVDEVGKFFIVEKPSKSSTIDDIVYEAGIKDFIDHVKGGLKFETILGLYKQKSDARRAGTEALKEMEASIKEMEDAMEAFRGAKKDIEEKKKDAKEKIEKLK